MANKDLRYFMREEAKVEQIVTVPGPESIKDENGEVIQLEIKQLHKQAYRLQMQCRSGQDYSHCKRQGSPMAPRAHRQQEQGVWLG